MRINHLRYGFVTNGKVIRCLKRVENTESSVKSKLLISRPISSEETMNGFNSFKCALIALVLTAVNFWLPNNNLSLPDAQDDWLRSTPYKAYAPHFFYEMKDNDEVPRYIVSLTGDEVLGYGYHVPVAYLQRS